MDAILFYLVNDTIEIIPEWERNSGRDKIGKLLSRAKIVKIPEADGKAEEYYHWKDLYIGMNLPIYGRILQIVDCDQQTRDFYREEGGIELGPPCRPRKIAPIEFKNTTEEEKPDYTAIGVESAQPKKRNGENKQLTFRAKLLSGGADDVDREFIITYYCLDDTIQILEPPMPRALLHHLNCT